MNIYEANVVTHPRGHQLTESDYNEAKDLFMQQALSQNPNGLQGDPELLGSSLIVGQQATWSFRIGLVEAVTTDAVTKPLNGSRPDGPTSDASPTDGTVSTN